MSVDPVVRQQVARLFNRAGFGASVNTIDTWAAAGYNAAVNHLLSFPPAANRPDTLDVLLAQELAESQDSQPVNQRNIGIYGQWWINRMATAMYPLEEKLTLYWHGHFATSFYKTGLLGTMVTQNRMLRENAGGDFRHLCNLVTADPAMLQWLDNGDNRLHHTNENYAREFMELFTLGRDMYTQTDVTEVARAFTGYQVSGYTSSFNNTLHDNGTKVILGNGPADYGPSDVVNLVLDHHPQGPVAANYVAQRVASFFHRPNPPAGLVGAMAASFAAAAGQPYPIKAMLHTLFTSSDFMNDTLTGIKSPAELVAGAVGALGESTRPLIFLADPNGTQWADASRSMGQELFAPPNVGGWRGGRSWANAAGALERYNFAVQLGTTVANDSVQQVLDSVNGVARDTVAPWMSRLGLLSLSATTQQGLSNYLAAAKTAGDASTTVTRGILILLLSSPDYMLR